MDGFAHIYLPSNHALSAQEKFAKQRVAEQRRQRSHQNSSFLPQDPLAACYSLSSYPNYSLARTTSGGSTGSGSGVSGVTLQQQAYRDGQRRGDSGYGEMDSVAVARIPPSSRSSSSSTSEQAHQSLLSNPFELRHGRRYLRNLPYPLPVDLAEIHRQNLKTLLKCKVFGERAVCSPAVKKEVPKKVLEIACGSGFWSAKCHEYFSSLGHTNVSFTGLDVAPLAPDMRKQGMNWKFVQHDLRRAPWPFEDEAFDLVMLKDTSMVMPIGSPSQSMIDESLRVLAEGGTLEIWETDNISRCLLPHPPAVAKTVLDRETAAKLGVFLVLPGTPFAQEAQNKYLQHANSWIKEALKRRNLPQAPCTRVAPILYEEADKLSDVGTLRIAIPLGELRWEKEGSKHGRSTSDARDSVMSRAKGKVPERSLTPEQEALRQTALLVVLQNIESLEPLLKEASGKNTEEWSHWWASMMNDLLSPSAGGGVTSEVLEAGAWWATKTKTK